MAELIGYPFVNQLNSPTLDQRPDENKWFNCVIASIISAMLYRKPELRGKITPDSMKDAVLGEGYANQGTDARWFVKYVAQFGLKLYFMSNPDTIALAHQMIQEDKPALFTEIDPYVDTSQPQYAGYTHVCSFYKEIPGGLDAMDPFGGKIVGYSDAEWASKLRSQELWTVDLMEGTVSTLDNLKAHGWKDDGTTLTAPNGVPVVLGFRSYVLANNWDPNNLPVIAQYYISQLEVSNPALGPGDQQPFYDTLLGYPHAPQSPWEGLKGKVIVEYVGKELVAVSHQVSLCVAQIKQLQAQLAAQPPSQNPQAGQALVDMQQIKAIAGKY